MEKILTLIRKETAPLHKETETLLFPGGTEMDREHYIFFLRCNAGFHQALEPKVSQTGFSHKEEWKSFDRKKLSKLQYDLKNLGEYTIEDTIGDYFHNWSESQLLGAAYVSEGSSLGGQVMLKYLRKKSFFEEESHGTFLSGYGRSTGMAWENFLHLLDKEGQKDPNAVIEGAVRAFEAFKFLTIHSTNKENSELKT